ncbi:MAG TPA: site-specific integrase [Candidatus Acidoferrum sp.]|jgi:site-specific recombinase XerD|nr:site-specific integrase [Candidatus Acidoferrum sp.]
MRGVFERPPGSGEWWINYHDADGKRHREKIGRYDVAVEAYLHRRTEVREGKFRPPRNNGLTFGELAKSALAHKKTRLAPASYAMDMFRNKRLKEFETMPAAAVTTSRIDETLRGLRETGISGSTVNRYRSFLSSVFSYGMRHGLVMTNPVARVPKFKENEPRIRFLGADEEKTLRATIRTFCPEREAELDIALHTGLRRGEQFALKWQDVDLERGILTVAGGKTGRRFVPINTAARAALEKMAIYGHIPYVHAEKRNDGQRDWRRWFEDCVREAKIENFTWHDIRHTFASRLVMAGVDLRTVQELLGHKSILMTMRYAHLSPNHKLAAVEKLTVAPPARITPIRRKRA